MICLLNLFPRNTNYESFYDIESEMSENDLQQLESMCKNGVNVENQTFYMNLTINPILLERHNYDLTIQLLVDGVITQYDVKNAMTKERSDTKVEFIVVNSVSRCEIVD